MAIEIVDFPMKNGDFPYSYVKLPEGNWLVWRIYPSFYMGILKFLWVPQNHGCQY